MTDEKKRRNSIYIELTDQEYEEYLAIKESANKVGFKTTHKHIFALGLIVIKRNTEAYIK